MTPAREIRLPAASGRRIGVALLLLALVTATVVGRYLAELIQVASAPRSQETFIAFDRLFAQAVASTSLDARIGFWDGRPVHADERADGNTAIFYLAQYAVAPRVMVADSQLPLVLVLLPGDTALTRFCREHARVVLSHPAPGLALTQRAK